jgi:hypothetical protein
LKTNNPQTKYAVFKGNEKHMVHVYNTCVYMHTQACTHRHAHVLFQGLFFGQSLKIKKTKRKDWFSMTSLHTLTRNKENRSIHLKGHCGCLDPAIQTKQLFYLLKKIAYTALLHAVVKRVGSRKQGWILFPIEVSFHY